MESLHSRLMDWRRYQPGWFWGVAAACLLGIVGGAWALWPGRLGDAERLDAARLHIAQKDYAAAAIDARNLLQADPSSVPARLLFAQALLGTGDVAGAQEELRRAAASGAAAQDLMPTQAAALLAEGQYQQVAARFKDAAPASDAVAAELAVHVATALLNSAQAEAAVPVVEAALKRVPGQLDASLLQARLSAALGHADQARQQVQKLLELHPRHAATWLLQGELLSADAGSAEQAGASMRKAIEMDPRLADAHAKLIVLLLRQGDMPGASTAVSAMGKALPNSSQTLYLQALVAYVQNDHVRARERLQLLQFDDNPRLLAMAGTVESRLGNLVQADALLSKSLQLKPDEDRPRRELALVHLQRGQPERALATLDKLLARDSKDAEAWRLAGQAYARQGNFARADEAFRQVKRLQPGDKSVAIDSARVLMARGQVENGLRELEAAARADDKRVSAELEMVSAHMVRKDPASALVAVEGIARKLPQSPLPDLMKGQIQVAGGNLPAARAAFEAALAKDASLFAAAQGLAELDLRQQQPDQAKRRFTALLDKDPKSSRAMLALAAVVRRSAGRADEAVEWIDKAVRVNPLDVSTWRAAIGFFSDGGDTANALSSARAAIAAVPDNPELLALLAQAQVAEGDTLQALGNLNRLLELRPGSHEAHLLLAQAQQADKRYDKALASCEKALELAPDSAAALRATVKAALLAQRAERASKIARDLQTRRPQLPLGWQLEGEIQMAAKHHDAAAAAFRVAQSKAPSGDGAWSLHAALTAASKTAEARQVADAWLKQQPTDVTFLNRLAEAAQNRGDLADAESRFRQALKVQPDSPLLMNNLAYLLVLRKDPAALDMAVAAAKAAPYSPPIMDTVAHAYAEGGNTKKALEWQSRAVQMAPKVLAYRLQLVKLHLKAGEKKDARDELERALAQVGSGPVPAEAKALAAQAAD